MFSFLLFSTTLICSWFLIKRRMVKIDTSYNVLLVTAHPDDELMFFGPMLLNEIRSRVENQYLGSCNDDKDHLRKRSKVHLLCLSNGNYYGDGRKRQQELNDACNQLLKSSTNLNEQYLFTLRKKLFTWEILDDAKLVDSPVADWPPEHIVTILQGYIRQHEISKVVTFDQYGVSGHRNHLAIFEAVRKLAELSSNSFEIWLLESVSIIRKYLAVFDILFTGLSAWYHDNYNVYFLLSLKDYLDLVLSLRKHRSQMVWFRRLLYASTSRYMFINTFKTITPYT